MHVLSPVQVDARLRNLPGWKREASAIARTYTFRRFLDGIAFVNDVAKVSEHFDHHPDIDIRFKQVTLRWTTWDAAGITEKDFEMALRSDRLEGGQDADELVDAE